MKIHHISYGQGMPLVFFHGWGFDSQIWMSLVPHLEDTYQLILVDLPGFGQSSIMDWDAFKKILLDSLPERFALAGWSMGGLYATRLAIEEPQRVMRLLNITSSPRFITDTLWPGVSRDVFLNFYKNLATDSDSTLKDFISLQLLKSKKQVKLGLPPTSEGLKSGLTVLDQWDLRDGLHQLSQPVCFMFGRLDPITPIKTMTIMQNIYPDFQYVLFKKSAHMPFISHTDLFIEEIMGFFQ